MKKIISNRVYNTETAKLIGEWSNDYGRTDFRWAEEALYLKKTGEYFLHGQGGGLSIYAGHCGDSSGDGEKIMPLSYDKAREWAEEKLDADTYMNNFEVIPDDDVELSTITAYVNGEAKQKLDIARQRSGKTISEIIEDLLIDM